MKTQERYEVAQMLLEKSETIESGTIHVWRNLSENTFHLTVESWHYRDDNHEHLFSITILNERKPYTLDDMLEIVEDLAPETQEPAPRFYIIDATSNDPAMAFVVDPDGDTIHTHENCMNFDTEERAEEYIKKKGWDWAGIEEL